MNNVQVMNLAGDVAGRVHGVVGDFGPSADHLNKCDSMMNDMEAIAALKHGSPLPQKKLIELRFKGMQAVRFEFIVRLMRLKIGIYTLSIYWEDGRDFMQIPTVQKDLRKLVFASEPRVSGKFEDISLLCYAHDPAAKAKIDAELDRMVAVIGNFFGEAVVSSA